MTWYLDAGVDETIGDKPVNRYESNPAPAQKPDKPPATPSPRPSPRPSHRPSPRQGASDLSQTPLQAPHPAPQQTGPGNGKQGNNGNNDTVVHSAYELAEAAQSVAELRVALESFDGCALQKTAMNLVFTDGNPEARVLLVGEAPGAEEDRQGIPFVGPSGKLLDQMLASIGLDRDQVLITNTVFWRPPGNRSPTTQEIAICLPFLERLIELVDPAILVPVGGPAATELLAQSKGITKLRGQWFTYATPRMASPIPATALFHPAYLLRSPAQKREVWKDLLAIRQKLTDVS